MQDDYLVRMVKNLPVLRAAVGITQEQLSKKIGVSRQTIVAIENRKSPLSWSLYLAMICIFERYYETKTLLEKIDLFSDEFVVNNI